MKELDIYFEKCIIDAYKAEEREFKPERVKWFYIVVDRQLLFSVETPYTRVTRRIINRINNNIWKNFNLYNNGDYFLNDTLDPNFVCDMFHINGKKVYLCKGEYSDNQGEVIPNFKYEQLCKAYHNVTTEEFKANLDNLHLPFNMEYDEYREVYFKAFNKYPEVEVKSVSKTIT